MKIKILALVFFLLPLLSPSAHAAFVVDWIFLNDNVTVNSDESVQLMARIINEPYNSGGFVHGNVVSVSLANVPGYDAVLGTDGSDPFVGLYTLELNGGLFPGEVFDFVLGTYVPSTVVLPGIYNADPETIFFRNAYPVIPGTQSQDRSRNSISNSFTWTVSETTTAIPEPSTMLLMLSGLLGLPLLRQKK